MGTVNLIHQVKAPDAKNPDGGYAPVSAAAPLPVTGAVALMSAGAYRTVGEGGAQVVGDGLLGSVLVVPASTQVGPITIRDDGGPPITIFAGGTLPSLVPFRIDVGARGSWVIDVGSGLSILATGDFA